MKFTSSEVKEISKRQFPFLHSIAEHKEGIYLFKLHLDMEFWNLCKLQDPSIFNKGEIQLTRCRCP